MTNDHEAEDRNDGPVAEPTPEPEGAAFASDEVLRGVDDVADGADTAEGVAGQADEAADDASDDPDWDLLAAADDRTPGQLLHTLATTTAERDEFLDGLRRKQAEFENFRKRMMRDGAGQRIAGHAEVAERLLDVLDDFDRTLDAASDDLDPGFVKGVALVNDKLTRVLQDFGLRRIDDEGEVFDPNRHEAVQQVPADESLDEPVVAQVLRPGYELGDRVLRPAMVAVKQ
jgi:molecular chaperone GrpE